MRKVISAALLCLSFLTFGELDAQWIPTRGPYVVYHSNVYSLCNYSDDNGKIILLAGTDHGIFISKDEGEYWSHFEKSPTRVLNIIHDGNNIYCAGYNGFRYSEDNGISWAYTNLNYTDMYSLASAPNAEGGIDLYVGSFSKGVFRSSDKGKNWTVINTGLPTFQYPYSSFSVMALTAVSNESGGTNLLAGNLDGIYMSTDNGTTWKKVSTDSSITSATAFIKYKNKKGGYNILSVVNFSKSPGYAGNTPGYNIYESTDNGFTWRKLNDISPEHRQIYTLNAGLDENGNNVFYAADEYYNIYKSTDDGESWNLFSYRIDGVSTPIINTIMACPNNNGGQSIYCGTKGVGGVRKSIDGGETWALAGTGLAKSQYNFCLKDFKINSDSETIFATNEEGIFRSDDYGENWMHLRNGLRNNTPVNSLEFVNAGNDSSFLIAGAVDGIYRSFDAGMNWAMTTNSVRSTRTFLVNSSGSETKIYAAYSGQLFLSTDLGINWKRINDTSPRTLTEDMVLVPDGSGGFDLLVAGNSSGLYITKDDGNSWTVINNGIPEDIGIHYLYLNNGILYLISYDKSYISKDNGVSWSEFNGNFPISVFSLVTYNSKLIAGTFYGVFVSDDGGINWKDANQGLTNHVIKSLAIHGDYLFAGIDSAGVWRRPLSELSNLTDVHFESSISENFALSQNYPNPFNPSTVIKYSVPPVETLHATSLQNVSLIIYDVLGRKIQTLVDEIKAPGNYEVNFDGSDLASGIYFYQLLSGNTAITKKMILMK